MFFVLFQSQNLPSIKIVLGLPLDSKFDFQSVLDLAGISNVVIRL